MKTITLWNSKGEPERIEPPPYSWSDWHVGEPLSPRDSAIFSGMKTLLGSSVQSSKLLAENVNITKEISLSNSRVFILRVVPFYDGSEWEKRKFESEVEVMSLLAPHSPDSIAVPKVYHSTTTKDYGYMVIEKLPGCIVLNCYGLLSAGAKENATKTFASMMLWLFRFVVPGGKIGSISPDGCGASTLMPRISIKEYSPDTIFDTLEQYIESLVELARAFRLKHEDSETYAVTCINLDRLLHLLRNGALLQGLEDKPHLLRSALKHDDLLRPFNVLLDPESGNVSGIVDWEHHSVLPAVLVAEYPCWLIYDGCFDLEFVDPPPSSKLKQNSTLQKFWVGGVEECRHYRVLYDNFVKAKDPEYYDCLIKGRNLRAALGWLSPAEVDPGCERLGMWLDATFGPKTV
ncbi:hypothetical protein K435DRAFT_783734 [Dendrothele bispora CBS 962.96]|uniref:Aminoglycoside phosphotransferase domain-containing protein n=1 Tax=Dendrothele bispora (strain CBS 962.96) TaxID=1314807 RepID=A0A4S8L749_DENBC|nr:hypothetical protein K435DRAFT_783734 [Dendrothele bispora CBS 962.96]